MTEPPSAPPTAMDDTVERQKALYNRIAADYAAHYGDRYSLRYRDRFINGHMFAGLPLAELAVLDAACGSGETTAYLAANGARVTGLDISEAEIANFRTTFPACHAVCASVFETGLPDASFDCVSIASGLHHLHPNVSKAIDEVHRVLKPAGMFCFLEPHQGSLADEVRKRWYRADRTFFETNEAAIDYRALRHDNARRFEPVRERYGGNLGYVLVFESLILRIPLAWKRWYAPPLLFLEGCLAPFQGPWLSCFVIAQWRKK